MYAKWKCGKICEQKKIYMLENHKIFTIIFFSCTLICSVIFVFLLVNNMTNTLFSMRTSIENRETIWILFCHQKNRYDNKFVFHFNCIVSHWIAILFFLPPTQTNHIRRVFPIYSVSLPLSVGQQTQNLNWFLHLYGEHKMFSWFENHSKWIPNLNSNNSPPV